MPKPPLNNSEKFDYLVEQLSNFANEQKKFSGQLERFDKRQVQFEKRQVQFEKRQVQFEKRQDRFEKRQDRFEENQQIFIKKLESLEFDFDEKVEQLRAIIIEIGETNSQEIKNLRKEVMEKIDRLLIAMDAQSRDFDNFQTEKRALGASVDRLQSEVDKLKDSDSSQAADSFY